jgi:glutamyl-tRNA synthetase
VYSSSILIEQADAITFEDNEELTLMDWGNAYVRSKTVDPTTGLVTALKLELHLEGDFKKTKKKVTWLSSSTPTHPLTPVTLLDFDYLITKKKLEEDDQVTNFLSPETEFVEHALADGNVVKDVKVGETIQFERKGTTYVIRSRGRGGGSS